MNTLSKYNMLMEGFVEPDPIERLRFFLSIALTGQDWLDVEQFIDGVSDLVARRDAEIAELRAELRAELATMTTDRDEWKEAHDVVLRNSQLSDEQHDKDMEGYAAAIAACTIKDKALRTCTSSSHFNLQEEPVITQFYNRGAVIHALTIQPDEAALEAWLGEPVAFLYQHEDTGRTMCVEAQQIEWHFEQLNPRLHKIGSLYSPKELK